MNKWHAACLVDRSGNILSWNLDCAELFSRSSSEILYHPLANLFSGTSGEQCAVWLATMPEKSGVQELELQQPDGNTVEVTLMLVPQFDPTGQVNGLIAVFSFPSRYATEADLIRQTPLSAISNLFPGAFFVINQAHRFVLWNGNLESLTGLAKDELPLVDAGILFDDAARQLVEHKVAQVFKSGEELNLETELRSKSGATKPLLLSGTRIECEGKQYFFGIGYDISRRHEQERQLRLRERALHAANNAIVITRCEENANPIEYVNPAFERISAYARDECMGRDSRFMAAPGLDDDQRAILREAILQKQGVNVVFRNLRKNGELFWNDLTITPVTDEHDNVSLL